MKDSTTTNKLTDSIETKTFANGGHEEMYAIGTHGTEMSTNSGDATPTIDPQEGDLLIGTIWQNCEDLKTQLALLRRALAGRNSIEDGVFIRSIELIERSVSETTEMADRAIREVIPVLYRHAGRTPGD